LKNCILPPSHSGFAPAPKAGPSGHPGSTPGGGVFLKQTFLKINAYFNV